MELLLRVSGPGHPATDLRIDADHDQPVAVLATALAEHLELTPTAAPRLVIGRTGEFLDPEQAVGESGIVSGDEVVVDPDLVAPPPPPTPLRAISLDVLAGPDSGRSAVFDRGTYLLGRDPDCDIRFSDPTISRHHLRVEVGADWVVTLTPEPDTENGVLVNDEAVGSPITVDGDDVVTLGTTRVAFREFIRATDEAIDRLGQIEFHRTPYRPQVISERELEAFGPIPTKPEPRRFQLLALLAPIVAGLVIVRITGRIEFLAFVLISPLIMIGTWWDDRRTGRHRHRKQVETFHQRLEARGAEVRAALAAERIERLRAAPDLADLARRAELRTIDLWCRDRHAADFLRLRVGMGDTTSLVTAPLQPNGDDDLREAALDAVAGVDEMPGVPITVSLADAGTVAVHGNPDEVDDVAAALIVQAACLHSPEDLVIAAAIDPDRHVTPWLKWLPQVRSVTSPLGGRHLVTDADDARRLLGELIEVAELRTSEADRRHDRRWPWVLVVLDADLDPDPTLVSQLLDRGPEAGISVLWLSTSEARIPRQARAIVDCQPVRGDTAALLWHTDPGVPDQRVELGRIHPEVADRVARSLAPVRDASVATATTAIPRSVPLLSALGTDHPDAAWVAARWATDRPYGLEHPVGVGSDGVFTLDLVADGPHALIGGTSGAGKSELLQSMVASLVTLYPPTRLNFLFVDYKGGASSTVFRPVPHTVGYVTNLDAELAMRALTSLRAELNRRMQLLEGKAKDLEEMLARHPDEAPPSLVIVVDEFATLVKEIPDFVAGMVDIAQRGRSLGIHLVLATQRPSGSVNDNILANTNLRLSLRMLDAGESSAIIGSPDAADIPVPLRGRGFARLGPRELVPFQSAYASAPLTGGDAPRPVVITPFTLDTVVASAAGQADAPTEHQPRTQLDAVIEAVVDATRHSHFPPSRAPWREMLADHITVDEMLAHPDAQVESADAGRRVTIGVVDDPEHQSQYPAVADLEEGGGLLVFGAGGSGRTTLLRTMATVTARSAGPDEVVVFGLDFASRALRSIEPLPHVSAIGTGDDLEAVTRILALLGAELDRRRRVLAAAQAETLTAYRADGGTMPRILLLVDGYPNLAATFSGGGLGTSLEQWLDALHRVILDGRQVGIHTVLTADRRGGIPAIVQSAVANRVILRQADEGGYGDHGITQARARTLDLEPGRGLWQAHQLVQIACVAATGEGRAQADALKELGSSSRWDNREPALTTAPLPDRVDLPVTARENPLSVVLGLADLTLDPVLVDLDHSNLLVAGLPRSGRSTAAARVARSLVANGVEVWVVGPASSPLAGLGGVARSAFGRADSLLPVLDELASVGDTLPGPLPRTLIVDDLDGLDDPALNMAWDRLAKLDTLRVVATIETRSVGGFSPVSLLNEMRKARRAIYLQPDDPMELFQATGVRPPVRPGTPMPPGRGVLVVDRMPAMVQVALP